jgi:hypothetical protein
VNAAIVAATRNGKVFFIVRVFKVSNKLLYFQGCGGQARFFSQLCIPMQSLNQTKNYPVVLYRKFIFDDVD